MCVCEKKCGVCLLSVYFNKSVDVDVCMSELTCVDAVLVSGAVAVNGEGGAREGVGCCCCDNSELAPPTATAPVPDDDPSAPEKTPAEKHRDNRRFNLKHITTHDR